MFPVLRYFKVIIYSAILNMCLVSLVGTEAMDFFREANEEVRNKIKNDRSCNFMLGFQDAHLRTPAIIEKYGYPAERHWVTTEDGYSLEIHRMPPKKGTNNNGQPTHAIFLMHGVLSSSRDFVLNCDRRALAFQLWENGYDVWMGNFRGNLYCQNHTVLSVDNPKFWDFSVDEIGFYDVPAMINYILKITTLKKITYIGHSMGNGVGLIAVSTRPEFNNKIDCLFAMSAALTLEKTSSTYLKMISSFPRTLQWTLTRFNRGQLFAPLLLKFLYRFSPTFCRREARKNNYHGFCAVVTYIVDGYDPGQIPPELWTVLAGEFPNSTSVKFLCQWMQWIITGNFTMFDEGPLKNLKKYGTVEPKRIPIEKTNIPVILFWGENDLIISPESVRMTEALVRKLRPDSEVEFLKIESPHWNHLDFVYGKDADIYVYKHILEKLRLFHQNHTAPALGNRLDSIH